LLQGKGKVFALRVSGDSMEPEILDGDVVVISTLCCENGETAVVRISADQDVTLKKIYRHNDLVQLVPANKKYQPLVFTNEELKNIEILGKVIYQVRKY
jgi:repressor LexA